MSRKKQPIGHFVAAALAALVPVHSARAEPAPLQRCIADAAQLFGHTEELLAAIVRQESSGKCASVNRANADRSYDIGCMQINSSWLPVLQSRFGISEQDLFDPCINVNVGAWILAGEVRRHGNTWRAVGAYNAKTESKRISYAWKVRSHLVSR
jgi:soluble lytic murein transglycosylase-like protein